MEDDLERVYWFTVQDCAKVLTGTGVELDVFLSDVYDSVVRLNPTDPAVLDMLAVLEQIGKQLEIKRANQIASEVFKA